MDHPTKKPAPTTSGEPKDKIKPAMRLPVAEHPSAVVRAMVRTKAESRQPSQSKSRSIKQPEHQEKAGGYFAAQLGDAQKVKPVAVVTWQPPSGLPVKRGKHVRGRSVISFLQNEPRRERARVEEEKAVVALDMGHVAADTLMDKLGAMFKPTLEGLGDDDSDEDEGGVEV